MEPEILVAREGAVAIISLNRPKVLNAITASMADAYADAMRAADADPSVRVIVVAGEGRGFCAGADLGVLRGGPEAIRAFIPARENLPSLAYDLRKPVIAAADGPVAGVGLAYLMNYSGLNYTLGLGVASVGFVFPLLSPFLGWVAVFLSGSDTSGNALFGNLQVVAANQLGLNPVLIAATNSSGGVMGKMISPQNIATGVSVTDLKGQEGVVFARTFKHSIVLTLVLGLLVLIQQYVVPGIIP